MSIFDKIGKATYKINNATNKVGGAIIKGVSAVKAIESIGPTAVGAIGNVIKTAISISGNVERQIRETELGRRALAGIDNIAGNIVGGVINSTNVGIFQDTALIKGLINLKSPAFNGSVRSFADVADLYASLQPEDLPYAVAGNPIPASQSGVWSYQSAAAEMANIRSNQFTPKYKFQFIVDVELAPELQGITTSSAIRNFTFLATEVDRPGVKYTMEEVNSYNFRFSVPKKMAFNPVTISLLDDNANDGMRLLMSVIRSISPILNCARTSADIESNDGIRFTDQQSYYDKDNNAYLASLGPVQSASQWLGGQVSDTTSPILSITVYHLYDKSGYVNLYQYINPKVTDVDFDKLSMIDTANQVNELKFSFVYDWVNVTDSVAAVEHQESLERSISNAHLVVDSTPTAIPIIQQRGTFQVSPQQQSNTTTTDSLQSAITNAFPKLSQAIELPRIRSNTITPPKWSTPGIVETSKDWLSKLEF